MKTYQREFESKEAIVTVETNNYEHFVVYKNEYRSDFTTHEKIYTGSFTSEELDEIGIGWAGEKFISDFLADRYSLTNVYSLNDFSEVTQ